MNFDFNDFNAEEVEPLGEFTTIPAGKYLALIEEGEFKPNKAGSGRYLELKFQILEGEYKGRNLWARLNLEHPNPMAVKIARSELSSICRAVGVLRPKGPHELFNLPLIIKVKVEKRKDNGEDSNRIAGYYAKGEAAAPQAESNTPPWQR